MRLFGASKIDLLAVGDTAIDAFIRIKDAEIHCNIDHEACELCMRYGDKIPYEFNEIIAGVGNSANAAVAAARLGLRAGLVAHIGSDQYGKDVLAALSRENVDTSHITKEKGKTTNYHYVLWYQSERTILIKHEAFSYIFKAPKQEPRWLYLSSLGDHTETYHDAIADYLEAHPGVKLAFQPGTFQIKLGAERLSRLYKRTDVFVCNVEEAGIILGEKIGTKDVPEVKGLLSKMAALGPRTVLITDGPKGAYAFDSSSFWFMPPYPDPKSAYERTGAGDAFASTFVSALILGKSVTEALEWAPINSMSVVQQVGAQKGLLSRAKLEADLLNAPSDYEPKQI